ncbi:para-aminobenzoate synthetase component 1 [Arcticibacter pallidicorallinus]|uniref:aminodeoxychorismate synthase n=1 Tax=Arcticibacter pallidicorallinus TaxID=1259464 RepID=A0A2T0U2Z9_9SPHI|nr:aminodeoxychorismate synthase component I [Arcticibacter pallidicorallinus]PRY52285.1 para-aminobenzoate synthetase component 1 [Arcticibacter pallidicorallinus]
MQSVDCILDSISEFKRKALQWATSFEVACFFDSNEYKDRYSSYTAIIAAGVKKEFVPTSDDTFSGLSDFLNENAAFTPGFICYDVKNELEDLNSSNPDRLHFPDMYFFVPQHLLLIKDNTVEILSDTPSLFEKINAVKPITRKLNFDGKMQSSISRESYIQKVNRIREHIRRGDIYEMNFCQQFFSEDADIDPLTAFIQLNRLSPAPFSSFFKLRDKYIMSSSPERFMKKIGAKVISQPIKGTAARGADQKEDEELKRTLLENDKELAENIMIVDLVRNDLTKSAIPGTVKVEELCKIYSFQQVHQMISTVTSKVSDDTSVVSIIKDAFPMGSMTGAPKVRSMELIEQFEETKRGIYSGAVGYFTVEKDFDFNVVIRSLIYNQTNQYLSFQVGSAITFASDAELEYKECMLKAKAMLDVLGQ